VTDLLFMAQRRVTLGVMVSRFASYMATLAALMVTLLAGTVHAQGARANGVHVLEVDSDDADDQAEALTGALRSHLRASPGWNLIETTQSLSMLTAALRCPRRPDPGCLGRIGDRLKADRFIWGLMNRAPHHQVVAELHFWIRGKPEIVAKETYSDNLKDQNDDSLRKIATGLLDQLIGAPPATLNVDAGGEEGTVVVDGEERGPLDHGRASLQVAPGSHVVEVHGPNLASKQTVDVKSPSTDVTFQPTPAAKVPPATPEPGKPFPTRKVVGWGAVVVGAALGAVAVYELTGYLDARSTQNAYASEIPSGASLKDACAAGIASGTSGFNGYCPRQSAVKSQATTDSALAWTLGGVGAAAIGTGLYLVLAGKSAEEHEPAPASGQGKLEVVPQWSPWGGGGLDIRGTF
jgi:hypothetical protein